MCVAPTLMRLKFIVNIILLKILTGVLRNETANACIKYAARQEYPPLGAISL